MSRREKRRTSNKVEHAISTRLDDLAEFERFRDTILPSIRKDLNAGLSPEQIMEKYAAVAAARLVSKLASHTDDASGDKAAESILDRTIGKPTQKVEATHRYADMSEDEIDALIRAKEVEAGIIEDGSEES